MSELKNNDRCLRPEFQEMMKFGYMEMAKLNVSLSEEGLYQDIINLESYEKYLVESE
ncbi:hypothetical protein [Sinanaerobacter chloroacetimidivorans]|jgi:hypothetical protein|uniref:Uncharacterized protein n=1 Tax=Sinanaerobacter chloroacetimidivorans TaxID=2818044 RepID=A0A8J7W161_9FIRM|nr:hypothetical protein [Sinanaerobacter chloroacetimidivorans]MBR0598917.1 hypothetical protein [Sinanaerobacter chloroacetimidivorans]